MDTLPSAVPKWKKDATKFPVSLSYNSKRGTEAIIPKPVVETLGRPRKITFIVNGKKVSVIGGVPEELQNQDGHEGKE